MKDLLIQFRSRRPFVPFRVVLAGGESVEITRPTSIGCGLNTAHIVYPDGRKHKLVQLEEIISAEPLERVG